MEGGLAEAQPLRRWLVTRVETAWVSARTAEDAILMGEEYLDFHGSETSNIEAEEQEV